MVDKNGKLIGRLTIDEIVDLIREESETEVLNMRVCVKRKIFLRQSGVPCITAGPGWPLT